MKLSDAIRLGSLLHPQCFSGLSYERSLNGDIEKSCSLGAARQAGWRYDDAFLDAVATSPGTCPACTAGLYSRREIIIHLNDTHRWTREAIADWVAREEDSWTPPRKRRSTAGRSSMCLVTNATSAT